MFDKSILITIKITGYEIDMYLAEAIGIQVKYHIKVPHFT